VAVVTTTGGGAAAVVDRLGLHAIELASMHDLTMTATADIYAQTLERLLASSECDAVLAAVGSSAQFHPELAVEPTLRTARADKPLAAFLTPHAERSLSLLAAKGVPAFRTPEACADAFAAYFSWRAPRVLPDLSVPQMPEQRDPFALLEALGIPVAEHAIVRPPEFEHSLAYPVALKRLDIEHKTEAGGVVLDVQSGMELRAQARRMNQQRLLVQRMERGLAEAIVGYRDDPVVGPLVLVGAGGTLAEIYRDFALACAPVSEAEARAMIEEVKGLAPIRGYRNLPQGDVAALARAVSALSRLALVPGRPVAEAEINPLVVKRDRVVAVDARLIAKA
jgi:acyl-CoA synthetase (NDP forming)